MEWYIILALVVGVAVILFPVAYVWYINRGGVYTAVRESQKKRAIRGEKSGTITTDSAEQPGIQKKIGTKQ
jgi:hypothetical protein